MVLTLGDTCTALSAHNHAQNLHTTSSSIPRLDEVSGKWSALMEFKSSKAEEKRSAHCLTYVIVFKCVTPEATQEPYKSRKALTQAHTCTPPE
ncbi:hypothetical protein EI94DRAFT_1751846 [Lactarius quietus]|nr:hypothetical protein EI94DRAFT_1751846 [Lactarius quietus]